MAPATSTAMPTTISAGAFRPDGVAVEVDGGLRVTGRWSLASGSSHANWYVAGCVIVRDGAPVIGPTGAPLMREVFFPASVHRDHRHLGLDRPAGYRQSRLCRLRRVRAGVTHDVVPGTAHDRPSAVPHAADRDVRHVHQRRVARHRQACDRGVRNLAGTKPVMLSTDTLADKPMAQDRLGRSPRARRFRSPLPHRHARPTSGRTSSPVMRPRSPTEERCGSPRPTPHTVPSRPSSCCTRPRERPASTARCALDRCLRDARTAVQHIGTQEVNFELAGRHLLES